MNGIVKLPQKHIKNLAKEIEASTYARKYEARRIADFLEMHEIEQFEDISYETRCAFIEYDKHMGLSVSTQQKDLALFDKLKIGTIAQKKSNIVLDEEYLLYRAPQSEAISYRRFVHKEALFFDFKKIRAPLLRDDFKYMFQQILDQNLVPKEKNMRFRILNLLMDFSVDKPLKRLGHMEEAYVRQFELYASREVKFLQDEISAFIKEIRRALFSKEGVIDWDCPVWYLDELHIDKGRNNQANEVITINLLRVIDKEERMKYQKYLKHLLSQPGLSISNIRGKALWGIELLSFIQEKDWKTNMIRKTEFEQIVAFLNTQGNAPETFNKKIACIEDYFNYLRARDENQFTFRAKLYVKKTYPMHINRSTPERVVMQILEHLHEMPEHLELMYWVMLETGRRKNEICTLKGDCIICEGGHTYIKFYQNKMQREIIVPVCSKLGGRLGSYIKSNSIRPDEYVFKDKNGKAFKGATFSKQMKQECEKYGISCGDYLFRAHDYRHRAATILHKEEVSIDDIKKFLGHMDARMTRRYVDDINESIIASERKYFKEHGNHSE